MSNIPRSSSVASELNDFTEDEGKKLYNVRFSISIYKKLNSYFSH